MYSLGDLYGLQEGMAEISEGGDFPGFDFALSGMRKDFAKSARKITGGEQFTGEPGADVAAES